MPRINLAIAVTAAAIGLAPAANAFIVGNGTSLNGHEQQSPSLNGQDLSHDLNGVGSGGHNLAASRVGPVADAHNDLEGDNNCSSAVLIDLQLSQDMNGVGLGGGERVDRHAGTNQTHSPDP